MLTQLEVERTKLLGRESVLVDLVLQQENHLKHLQQVHNSRSTGTHMHQEHDNSSKGKANQTSSSSQLRGAIMPPAAVVSATDTGEHSALPSNGSDGGVAVQAASGGQYCHTLLMQASREQWQRALSWSTKDWSDYYTNLVMRLCLLMELLGRLEGMSLGDRSAGTGSTGSTAAVGGSTTSEADIIAAKQDTLREIDEVVDDYVTMVNLCNLYNPVPFRQMLCYNHITGEQTEAVPAEHWHLVIKRVELTDEQFMQLQCGYQQYWRLLGKVQAKQQHIVQAIAASLQSTQISGQEQQHGRTSAMTERSVPGRTGSDPRSCYAAVTTAALKEREALEGLLRQHMAGWTAAGGLLLQFYCNTLTRLQLARMLIASYPFLPCMSSLIGILVEPEDSAAVTQGQSSQQQQHSEASRQQNVQNARRRTGLATKQHQANWRQRQQQQLLSPLGVTGSFRASGTLGAGSNAELDSAKSLSGGSLSGGALAQLSE